MAFPPGMTTCLLTISPPIGFDGIEDISTRAVVTATTPLVWAATGVHVLNFPNTYAAEAGMPLAVVAPHVDQPGFVDAAGNAHTMWAIRVDVVWTDASSGTTKTATKNVQPLQGQELIDLDLVPSGSIQIGVSAPIPEVLSVAGLTGAISASALTAKLGGTPGDGGEPIDWQAGITALEGA